MASALLPASHSLCKSNNPFSAYFPIFRYHTTSALTQKNSMVRERFPSISCSSLVHNSEFGLGRRDLMLFGLSSPLLFILPLSALAEAEGVKMSSLVDEINACSFLYPVELPSKKYTFKWGRSWCNGWWTTVVACSQGIERASQQKIAGLRLCRITPPPPAGSFACAEAFSTRVESRKPERYSSAAPLSPDARQRIVSEQVDIIDNLVISVSIGPPNSLLKSKEKSLWDAKEVADSVLSDKSALRITSAQRMAESSILDTHSNEIDGEPYWYYEYLVRKSPTKSIQEPSIFRHYVASTAERDGYLYSLNASTLNKQWKSMGPLLEKTVSSFRLLPPTENYVPPYKDPWRFW